MNEVEELLARIDGAIAAVKDKNTRQQKERLQEALERKERLAKFEQARAAIVEIAKPRLEALARRAGDRATVTPSVSEHRQEATFEFKSPKARIKLTFSVAPDLPVKNAVVEYDLSVIPVLWKFDSHDEFTTPIDAIDIDALKGWLDDRILAFVELFIEIHEGEIYDKAEYVEDPVANVKFPKFAAGASLEHGGQTIFFIDDRTKAEFARQKGIATA